MALRHTTLGQKPGIRSEAMTSKLYVLAEFARTLSFLLARLANNFQGSHELNLILP